MSLKSTYRTLRLILGDQLNRDHSWYSDDNDTLYVIMEMKQETDYTTHHIQKICGFFLAMEKMADWLTNQGKNVLHIKLNNTHYSGNLKEDLSKIIKNYSIQNFEYQLPDEYRLDQQLVDFCKSLDIESKVFDTEHFFTKRNELEEFFEGKKTYIMENFYRYMRKKHDILMEENGEPVGEKWNYDKQNRSPIRKGVNLPEPFTFNHDVTSIKARIDEANVKYIGNIDVENFIWPCSPDESKEIIDFFLKEGLENFGKYQDAMTDRSWLLFHSRLSFSMNTKMLSPKYIIQRAITKWSYNKDTISLAQIEGFTRQILGWREYMRGIYWAKMPEYKSKNFFGFKRKLPSFFWDADTKMNCLKHCISQSLDYAYAHHIQRLMVTGNFALLAGVDPDEVDEWYLGIYMDAIEWVEITNTRGMSQFADGGIVGTKPYISSANYINKMSDYCKIVTIHILKK